MLTTLCLSLTSCQTALGGLGCGGAQSDPASPGMLGEPAHDGVRIRVDANKRHQFIDGFGATGSADVAHQPWLGDLFYEDLRSSILRMDLTPPFRAPFSDYLYNSPWFHDQPPLPGPEGNNVRTYRDASDYGREWNGRKAQIAVLGPDIEKNIALLDFDSERMQHLGLLAQRGLREKDKLGDFKLLGSLWSPAPWLKRPSGGKHGDASGVLPKAGTPFPFIWNGNFAGGVLDTSGTPLPAFDDSAQGGVGSTSALTQFARGISAFLLGFQRQFGVPFHAVSIQNELGFEVFYNSCAYLRAEDYVAALKAARAELDRHAELRSVQIIGPEDLLGEDGYALWQFGAGETSVPKNLKFMAAVAKDPEAEKAMAWFAVHSYALDGKHAAENQSLSWKLWTEGWQSAPTAGLPDDVKGMRAYGKKSWMTETSGEPVRWIAESEDAMAESALGIASKIHNALSVGEQSAWLYWELANQNPVGTETLTDEKLGAQSPKYVAVKHFFRFIRPGSQRVATALLSGGDPQIQASAFVHDASKQLTIVLINRERRSIKVLLEGVAPSPQAPIEGFASSPQGLWKPAQPTLAQGTYPASALAADLPALSVTTLSLSRP